MIKNINYYLSNINLVNAIIGYVFFISILIPVFGTQIQSSSIITIPYRGLSLTLSLVVILLNIKSRFKYTTPILALIIFWFFFLFRMTYDMEIRTEFFVKPEDKLRLYLLSFGSCVIPMISIFKSVKILDLSFVKKLLFNSCKIILIPSLLISLDSLNLGRRDTGNIAIDAITFGSMGITLSLLSFYDLLNKNKINIFGKILNYIFILLGVYLALKSGSRGPILGFIISLFCFLFIKYRSLYILIPFFSYLIYISFDLMISLLSLISPIFTKRINDMFLGNDISLLARQESYSWFINKILEYPFFGSQFAKLGNATYPGYAHNIFLDVLLAMGIFGLILFCYIVYKSFLYCTISIRKDQNSWIALLLFQYLLLSVSSGAFYSNPSLNVILILSILLPYKYKNIKI